MDNRPPSRRRPASVYRRRRIAVLFAFLLLAFGMMTGARAVWNGIAAKLTAPAASSSPPASVKPTKSKAGRIEVCSESQIRVKVAADPNEVAAGSPVSVTASISLQAGADCLRDVGASNNEILVLDAAGNQIWSSDTCPVNDNINVVTMTSGAEYQVRLSWPGTSNPAKCGDVAPAVPAGEYQVVARNGSAQSEPAAITVK